MNRYEARDKAKAMGAATARQLILTSKHWYTGQVIQSLWDCIEYYFDANDREIGYHCNATNSFCEISRDYAPEILAAHRIVLTFTTESKGAE